MEADITRVARSGSMAQAVLKVCKRKGYIFLVILQEKNPDSQMKDLMPFIFNTLSRLIKDV